MNQSFRLSMSLQLMALSRSKALPVRAPWLAGAFCVSALALALAAPAAAQQEFTQQIMLITQLEGPDRRLAYNVNRALTGRVTRGFSRREFTVVDVHSLDSTLAAAGYADGAVLRRGEMRALGRSLRADEYIVGRVERRDGQIWLDARLILARDWLLQQPLPAVTGRNVDEAADKMAAQIRAARRQLADARRCENHVREFQAERAVALARQGMSSYQPHTILRACHVRIVAGQKQPPQVVIREATQLLQEDSLSAYGLEIAAQAYDQLQQRENAARMWTRLYLVAPDSVDHIMTVTRALIDGKNERAALPIIRHVSDSLPHHMPLLRLRWEALWAAGEHNETIDIGERLLREDVASAEDSTFYVRMVGVYRAASRPTDAVAMAAMGVRRFANDARLQLAYTELIRAETNVALDRALTRFPNNGPLLALRARELRGQGKIQESVEVLRLAVDSDSMMSGQFLQLADAYNAMGLADSTYAMIRRAVDAGESHEVIAQYSLARGNALYRAAARSERRDTLALALRFLSLSDSLVRTREATFLSGAAAAALVRVVTVEAARARSCAPAREAETLLPFAEAQLTAGAELAPEATEQQLQYLTQLRGTINEVVTRYCTGGSTAIGEGSIGRAP